jgi:multidrug efflux pump subunit AcrB
MDRCHEQVPLCIKQPAPREEEPQIKVPMIDVPVELPGFYAREVEERATRPMEKLLWEIPGVEYLYSISNEGSSLLISRMAVPVLYFMAFSNRSAKS